MKKVLFIKHIDIEGGGTLEEFLKQNGIATSTIEIHKEDLYLLSINFEELFGVVILGGPMNVYEEDKYPFLKWETSFIKDLIDTKIPVLGICLGAQLIAKVAGAKVYKAPYKELGWHRVNLREKARSESLFKGVKNNLTVFQWHEDTFDVPKKGVLLAKSYTINQAFRIGSAYGFQFHIEITPDMAREWIDYYVDKSKRNYLRILSEYNKIKAEFEPQRDLIFQNFLSILSQN